MDALKNLRVGVRLALGFGLLLAMLVGMNIVSSAMTGAISEHVQTYSDNVVPSLRLIHKVDATLSTVRRLQMQFLLTEVPRERKSTAQRLGEVRQELQQQLQGYEKIVSDAQDRSNWQEANQRVQAYLAVQARVMEVAQASAFDSARADEARGMVFGEALQAFLPAQAAIEKWWGYNEQVGEATKAEAQATHTQVKWASLGVSAAALLIGVLAAWFITRSITQPLKQAMQVVDAVADGDLNQRVSSRAGDELGQLLRRLDEMTQSLARTVSGVRLGCDQINVAAAEIAQGNGDLSARTESQASSLQETAASVEEMTAQIKANADNARQADQLARHASEVAQAGGRAVGAVVQTMDEISAASKKISDIIGTIDGIAFQTNILALNAAVEAARAGEQGRGFAVVAGEVRALAQRSAQAAKEISSLISESVTRVDSGSTQVHGARETIEQMVNEVRKVTDLVGEIMVSSREQSEGVVQINAAVSQLDQATQQNAALVEQTAAAAESMRQQSHKLSETVAVFRLGA